MATQILTPAVPFVHRDFDISMAAGLTLTRTIVHDVYGREDSGQVLADLTTAMIFAPMLYPGVGRILPDHVGWRAIFASRHRS